MTSLTPQTTTAPYKTYDEFFAGNQSALDRSHYRGEGTGLGEEPSGGAWGAGGNPYQYRNEYNEYLGTLAPEYQQLANANVNPGAITSGAVTGVWDPKAMTTIPVGFGTPEGQASLGSSHGLEPASLDVLNKMWR